jgi:rhodanese-related sulfurtransferase
MSDVPRISPAEAHAKMKDEAFTYVDVRTAEEFAAGHPEGAVNIPFEGDFVAAIEKSFAKDTPLVIGCKMGNRSLRAARTLAAAGFTRVLDQRAGWDGARGTFGELTEPGWSRTDLPRAR